ncbi:hypothetical protein T11_350 [Trichinella zimbabwensis]|uniref:Uncharacterized protein n=1 Tax=Trichinella zimbabwensis TaxID=268475 RepID=A0A0V1GR80_9BILA|nr:hypothetical protein T11_350 [Trichinella zimbabwensis]
MGSLEQYDSEMTTAQSRHRQSNTIQPQTVKQLIDHKPPNPNALIASLTHSVMGYGNRSGFSGSNESVFNNIHYAKWLENLPTNALTPIPKAWNDVHNKKYFVAENLFSLASLFHDRTFPAERLQVAHL